MASSGSIRSPYDITPGRPEPDVSRVLLGACPADWERAIMSAADLGWRRDSGHPERAARPAGGQDPFDAGAAAMVNSGRYRRADDPQDRRKALLDRIGDLFGGEHPGAGITGMEAQQWIRVAVRGSGRDLDVLDTVIRGRETAP